MSNSEAEGLKIILGNKDKAKKFRKFLTQEHSEENLLLYQAVTKYKKEYKYDSKEGILIRAAELCSAYLLPRGVHEVNIPGDMRRRPIQDIAWYINDEEYIGLQDFLARVNKYKSLKIDFRHVLESGAYKPAALLNLFDECQSQVFTNMQRDTYARYIKEVQTKKSANGSAKSPRLSIASQDSVLSNTEPSVAASFKRLVFGDKGLPSSIEEPKAGDRKSATYT